ncbi:MAG: PA14 domain-containing protein [Terriglobia bacterium]
MPSRFVGREGVDTSRAWGLRSWHRTALLWPCEDAETFRLYLDDKLVIDTTQKNRNPAVPAFQTHFANSQPHQIRLEYTHQSELYAAGITLVWKPPAQLLREEAVRLAKTDIVVAFIGLSPGLEN